jgi:sulfide:quinone oxidoreductase
VFFRKRTKNLGAFSKPNTNSVLTKIAADKHIDIVPNFEIERVDAANTTIHAFNGDSPSYGLLTIVAPIRGPTVLPEAGLANDMNYGLTDHRTLKSKVADNIYFIGDNTDLPTSEAGAVAHFEAETVVNNLLRESDGKIAKPTFDGHANCFIESGSHKALLIDFNYEVEPLPGSFPMRYIGPFPLLEETFANHFGKMACNGIYWHLIVSGSTPEMPFVPAHKSMVGNNLKATKEACQGPRGHGRRADDCRRT